ncbi:MAG: hypothetical protein EXS32_07530 [Opitutus sp.]|nr:hypothetical protein [Opitutus sp.]
MSDAPFLPSDPTVERRLREIGEKLFAAMDASPAPGIFSKKGAYARVMEWSMKDPAFKTQLFRFVDVLPSLHSSAEIVRHLQEYLGDQAVELNPAMKAGLAASAFAPALVAGPVKANIVSMAAQFVAGETAGDLVQQFRKNAQLGLATTIDLLGETVVSAAEADVFLQRNLAVLDTVAAAIEKAPAPCFSDLGARGPLPRLNLSVKISALTPDVHPADPENSIAALKQRLRPILRRAREVGAFINFDMESYKLKDLTLALFQSILEEVEFRDQPAIGIAIQAYLRDAERDLRNLVAWARKNNRPIGVRLVKGAYWDYETILAQQRDWPVPVWAKKPESDANFEKLSLLLFENIDLVAPAFATHNVRSCAHAIAQAERLKIDPRAYEFQALYGMANELKSALLANGQRVREYCAIGELLPGMAYLVRRLLENTSNEGFLRLKNMGEATREQLLKNPVELLEVGRVSPNAPSSVVSSERRVRDNAPDLFRNAPNIDFTLAAARDQLRAALAQVTATLGQRWPLVIGGKKSPTANGSLPSTPRARARLSATGLAPPSPTPRRPSSPPAPRSPRGRNSPSTPGPKSSNAPPRSWNRAATSSTPSSSSRRANRGSKPTAMSAKRSTSAVTTPSRCAGSPRPRSPKPCPANAACSSTRRAASGSSLLRGISRSRSCAA